MDDDAEGLGDQLATILGQARAESDPAARIQAVVDALPKVRQAFGEVPIEGLGDHPAFDLLKERWADFFAALRFVNDGNAIQAEVVELVHNAMRMSGTARGKGAGDETGQLDSLISMSFAIQAGVQMGRVIEVGARLPTEAARKIAGIKSSRAGTAGRLEIGEPIREIAREIIRGNPEIRLTACARMVTKRLNDKAGVNRDQKGVRNMIRVLFEETSGGVLLPKRAGRSP